MAVVVIGQQIGAPPTGVKAAPFAEGRLKAWTLIASGAEGQSRNLVHDHTTSWCRPVTSTLQRRAGHLGNMPRLVLRAVGAHCVK